MVIYVMAHVLLFSAMCSVSLEKSKKLTSHIVVMGTRMPAIKPQALEIWDMYGLVLYLLNNLTTSLLYATALFLS